LYYEAEEVRIWQHSSGQAAVIAVRGVLDKTEEQSFVTAAQTGAGWTDMTDETGQVWKLLQLKAAASGGDETVLCYFTAPSTELLNAMALSEENRQLAFFPADREADMKGTMDALAAAPSNATSGAVSAAALYFGSC
jgi:hypothetical protein